jgi:hypothetical protein
MTELEGGQSIPYVEPNHKSQQKMLIYTVNSRVIDYVMIEHAGVPQESNK